MNNAGISTTADVAGPVALKVFDTNAIGLIRVTQAALPLLEQSENPVVVNVSSGLGSFWAVTNWSGAQVHFPSIIYGSSKAAVSMLTVQYAKTFPGIKFNAVEPGFTATDLTPFSGAGQPVEKGAEVIVRMATIGKDGLPAPSRRARANSPGDSDVRGRPARSHGVLVDETKEEKQHLRLTDGLGPRPATSTPRGPWYPRREPHRVGSGRLLPWRCRRPGA